MINRATDTFWKLFEALPADIQDLAKKNYDLFQADPQHPSLQFKRAGSYWSARVGIHYHALALEEDNERFWVWIGPHAEYDKIVSRR